MPKPKRVRQTSNPLGSKINQVMAAKGIDGDYAEVARHFGVAVPSVYGWVDNGRINKTRLNDLAAWSGRPVTWWLSATNTVDGPTSEGEQPYWRFKACARALHLIDLLTEAAIQNHLEDADWQCLELMALRLRAAQATTAASDGGPARVKPEFQEELDHMVRSAEERRDQEQKQPKPPQRRTVSGQ